jgi:hypothetical protein
MRTLRLLTVLSLFAIMPIPATAVAKGLSGERYGFALLGARDYDAFSDPSISIRLGANLPINDSLDITPFFTYETVDEETPLTGTAQAGFDSYTLEVRGDYFITEKNSLRFYAGGGAGLVSIDAVTTDNELMFQAHGGMDIDLGEETGLRPECAYLRIGDDDDMNCGALFNVRLGESFNLLAEARFFVDNREIFYSIGGGMTF